MYAVIFRATIKSLDTEYTLIAKRMRDLAMEQYGCLEFVVYTEGQEEVALSYWPGLQSIHHWKNNAEHALAQAKGRAKWYQAYKLQVVNIQREYDFHA